MDRETVLRWLGSGLAAVDPRSLTARHLGPTCEEASIIAIGKAAAAMCWGAADVLGDITGICVTDNAGPVPDGVRLMVGDHPVPGAASFAAGRVVMEVAERLTGRCVALISGGGSALCEQTVPGVDEAYLATTNSALLAGGASIGEMNLVRSHLSAIKGGGLARAIGRPVETLIISDVAGRGPEVVASGPTLDIGHHPDRVLELLERHRVEVPDGVADAIRRPRPPTPAGEVKVIGDGHTAARAVVDAATSDEVPATLDTQWVDGPVAEVLERFLAESGSGVTIAAGEPEVPVTGGGSGGRNTHTAVLAALHLDGTRDVFAALASDGVDGASGSAGAIVDGTTLTSGGDPQAALAECDSAGYLAPTGSLIPRDPTGTNVGDLWLLWRR